MLPGETKRNKVTLKKSKTDPKFGCEPRKRTIKDLISYGIVIINKPKGPTSHQVAHIVKTIVDEKKTGHTGTLDPGVTGVLPVALGRATRVTQALLPAGKEYIVTMQFHEDFDEEELRHIIDTEYTGEITQLPPVKSAVKRQKRKRTIYYAEILEIKGRLVLARVGCQGGTYIRKWVHDLGQDLGGGAHMAQLVRTKAGPFTFDDMWSLQDLEDALWYYKEENNETFLRNVIRPVEDAVEGLPKIWVHDATVDTLTHGRDLGLPGVAEVETGIKRDDLVAVLTLKGELVCLSKALMSTYDMQKKQRGFAAKTFKVFMKSGIYPRIIRAS